MTIMEETSPMHIVVVIMAGGKGERFWPRSTNTAPKQFLSLWGEGTLLQQAFARALKVAGDISRIYVITGPDYGELVLSQLPGLPEGNLIIEPASRDTAPAVGYAMICLGQRIRDAVMVMMPSDHVVLDEERFVMIVVCNLIGWDNLSLMDTARWMSIAFAELRKRVLFLDGPNFWLHRNSHLESSINLGSFQSMVEKLIPKEARDLIKVFSYNYCVSKSHFTLCRRCFQENQCISGQQVFA